MALNFAVESFDGVVFCGMSNNIFFQFCDVDRIVTAGEFNA